MTRVALVLLLTVLLGLGCSEASTELIPARAAGTVGDAAVLVDAAPAPTPTDAGAPALCRGHVCECNDGVDEDDDGLIDGLDPECTSPFDDDESSFATGMPGGSDNLCQDCFWDNNSGSGDDGCQYHVNCLFGDAPTGGCSTCDVSAECVETCAERTPSGCDCFGCCEVTKENGDVVNVVLSESCSTEDLDDQLRCSRCVPNESCRNECGRCELCPGRRLADLPADCPRTGAEPRNVCEEGQQVCSESEPCPTELFYCQLGCCQHVVQ